MFFDAALRFDEDARRCDLALGEDGDLLLDFTSITPTMMSIGLDRRADPDDELPQGRSRFLAPASFSERRGCPGDALDENGDVTGSHCWLLERAKETETTRALYEFWLRESLEWVEVAFGTPAEVEVIWHADGVLFYRVFIEGGEEVTGTRRVFDALAS